MIISKRFCINWCYQGVDRQVFNHEGCPDRMYLHECKATLVIENLPFQVMLGNIYTYGPQCKPLQFPTNTHFVISPCKLIWHITSPRASSGSPTLDHIEACETKQHNERFLLRTCPCLVVWPTHAVMMAFAVERTPSAPHDCDERSFEKQ